MKKIGFLTAVIIPVLAVLGYHIGGVGNFAGFLLAFGIIPLMDYVIGTDKSNVAEKEVKTISNQYFYKFMLYFWTYIQAIFLAWALYIVAFGNLHYWYEWLGFTLSTTLITGGIGITVAHELGHKKSAVERFYSKVLLLMVNYMHFYIEHNKGHHVHVATPLDPATSRKNETFYAFWFRSVFYGYAHAWKIEHERLNRNNKKVISIHNNMIWFTALPIISCGVVTLLFSWVAGYFVWQIPVFLVVQSVSAFTLLEQVNYIEHYGIKRKELEPGRYERVTPLHSWNASQIVSNFFLFQLQRHSDHHANAIKRYQVLKHYDESPQLPTGYSAMIILALFPPLWFSVMNKRLEEWENKDKNPAFAVT